MKRISLIIAMVFILIGCATTIAQVRSHIRMSIALLKLADEAMVIIGRQYYENTGVLPTDSEKFDKIKMSLVLARDSLLTLDEMAKLYEETTDENLQASQLPSLILQAKIVVQRLKVVADDCEALGIEIPIQLIALIESIDNLIDTLRSLR